MSKKEKPSAGADSEPAARQFADMAHKAVGTGKNVANSLIDTNRSIWLAGLGAFSSIGRKAVGSPALKNFEALVQAGEALEEKSKMLLDKSTQVARTSVNSIAAKVDDQLGGFESVFDRRIADTLNRLSIPNRTEVAALMHRIELLEAEVKALKNKS